MAQLLAAPYSYFADANGAPLSWGWVFTYIAGTTTPQATYTDSSATVSLPNPIPLDSAGRAQIWLSGYYNIIVKDALNNVISTTDNVTAINSTGNMNTSIYDPANIQQQVVGTTASQTLTNKTLVNPVIVGLQTSGGFINRFRNVAFDVNQRGASGTVTSGNSQYTLDGWMVLSAGATTSWQQAYGQIGTLTQNYFELTGATGMTSTQVIQRIESIVAAPLANQTVTVQFLISNGTSATITPVLYAYYANALDNFSALTADVNNISLQPIVSGGVGIVAYTYNASSNASNGVQIILAFGASLNSASQKVYIGMPDIRATPGAALGINNSPPPSETRTIATELPFCQRYFETSYNTGTAPGTSTSSGLQQSYVAASSTVSYPGTSIFKVTKRAAPSVAVWDRVGNASKYSTYQSGSWTDNQGLLSGGNFSFAIGENSFLWYLGTGSQPNAGGIHWSASAEL